MYYRLFSALVILFCTFSFSWAQAWAEASVQTGAQTSSGSDNVSLKALTLRIAGDELRTRMVVNFDSEPHFSSFMMSAPYRLVVEMPETGFGFDENALTARGLVNQVRYGKISDGKSRMIFTLNGPFKVEKMHALKNENSLGYRLVIDVVAVSDREFAEAIALQSDAVTSVEKHDINRAPEAKNSDFVVVIDAGHGGIDSGASGVSGTLEKNVTLKFAQTLRDLLQQEKNFKVVMTREDDSFLRLGERVRIARQHEADLFISIHADSIRQSYIRGATVYTISDQASDAVARAMAERENKSDSLAGYEIDEAPEVADILLDLTRRETHIFSLGFADHVIDSLKDEIFLINNPHRFAGFQVLKAPDVPSVLLELGYLSNKQDEKLITDPAWREKMAKRLVVAIKLFAEKKKL